MADLHEDDDNHDVPPSISPQNNNLDLSSFQDSFHRPIAPPIEVNSVTHQSQPHSDPSIRVIEENDEFNPPGSGLGFLLQNPGSNSSQLSGLRIIDIGSDSDETRENEADDEDASFSFRWDVFDEIPNQNPNSNLNLTAYEDFEWEEVDDDDDALVLRVLLTAFEEPSEEPEWQVLSNVHNFDPDPEDQYEDYNYTEYQMFFADSDAPFSGRPPASKTVVDNLSTVILSQQHVCAVCKDEVVVGELVTQLPCGHGYHGGCILPWLAVRNTCPVCRHELPTDDADYERRKVQRGGNA